MNKIATSISPSAGGAMATATAATTSPIFLNEEDAAKLLNVSRVYLRRRRKANLGPPWMALSAKVIRYDVTSLVDWAKGNTHAGGINAS